MPLEIKGLSKSFGPNHVLTDVDLTLADGEFHALVGENGAGKSTLIKILAGVHRPGGGTLTLDGRVFVPRSPAHAQELGVSTMFQELQQIPDMTVAENIFLGREPNRGFLIDWDRLYREAGELLAQFAVRINPRTPMRTLTVDQAKLVEIVRAVSVNAKIIIMDEPSANLNDDERTILFDTIDRLRAKGITILYVSHRLEEIFRLADRVTVLRNGRSVGTHAIGGVSEQSLVQLMIGRSLEEYYPTIESTVGDVLVRCEDLHTDEGLDGASFDVRKGEVVGIAGLEGSGRFQVSHLLFGLAPGYAGSVFLEGEQVKLNSPERSLHHGIVLIPADRKTQGLLLRLSVRHNVSITNFGRLATASVVSPRAEKSLAVSVVQKLGVRPPNIRLPAGALSGGNQQKVVLGKWLTRDFRLMVLEEPTRGIDIGAKVDVYNTIKELAEQGKAVIIVSSDLPEMVGLCHRVIVMAHGTVVADIAASDATEERILGAAFTGVPT